MCVELKKKILFKKMWLQSKKQKYTVKSIREEIFIMSKRISKYKFQQIKIYRKHLKRKHLNCIHSLFKISKKYIV